MAAIQVAVGDIGELLSTQHEREKAQNRAMFHRILQNLCFLALQGLALRGDGEDSNFTQLLRLRAFDCPEVMTWVDRKTNKYTSGNMQNECLQVMALHILREVGSKNGAHTVMADECTDVSNKEQFTVSDGWMKILPITRM